MPCSCQELEYGATVFKSYIFAQNPVFLYSTVAFVVLFYVAIGAVLWKHRNKIWLKARSPKLLLLAIFFLCGDCVGNAVIFSGNSNADAWRRTCSTSIFVTVFFFYGVLMVYVLRMYRIEQVYLFYKDELEHQLL